MALTQEQINELKQKYANPRPTRDAASEKIAEVRRIAEEARQRQAGVTPTAPVEQEEEQSVAGGILSGIGKGLQSTVRGAAAQGERLITGLGRALTPKKLEKTFGFQREDVTAGEQLIPEVDTENLTTPEKIGFFGEQIAEFFIPGRLVTKGVTSVGKAGKGAQLATRAAGEAASAAGVTTLQEGTEDDALTRGLKTGAFAGVGVPVVATASKLTKNFLGKFTRDLGGTLSGKGSDVIERAVQSPKAARKGLKGDDVQVLKEVVTKAKEGVKNIKKESQRAYATVLDNAPDVPIATRERITEVITPPLQKMEITQTPQGLKFAGPLGESEERLVERAFNIIQKHEDFTPKGLNDLAIKVGKFRKSGPDANQLNLVIDTMKRNIRNLISEEVPELANANASFGATEDFLEGVETAIGINPSGRLTEKEIQKVSRKIQNLFGANKELARQLVDRLDPDITAIEAGRQLGQGVSRSTASIGEFAQSLLQAVIPEKTIGQIATATGLSRQKVKPIIDVLQKYAPAERAAVLSALRLIPPFDDISDE